MKACPFAAEIWYTVTGALLYRWITVIRKVSGETLVLVNLAKKFPGRASSSATDLTSTSRLNFVMAETQKPRLHLAARHAFYIYILQYPTKSRRLDASGQQLQKLDVHEIAERLNGTGITPDSIVLMWHIYQSDLQLLRRL